MINPSFNRIDSAEASGAATASLSPPDSRNYLTAAGAQSLHAELQRLLDLERPSLAASPAAVTKSKLHAVDQRIQYLQERLSSAEIVSPPSEDRDLVRFGATVAIEDEDGEVFTYRLVGVDEARSDDKSTSWVSPMGSALLNRRSGERFRLRTPFGDREYVVLHVEY